MYWGWDEIVNKRKEFFERYKNFLVLDIETVKDTVMLEEIGTQEEKEKALNGEFLPVPFHKVVAVSYIIVKDGNLMEFVSISSDEEGFLLDNFWTAFRNSHSKTNGKISSFPVLITVNGKDFDLPVLKVRSLMHIENIQYKTYISIFLDKFDKWEESFPKYTNRYTLFHIDIPVDIFGKKMSLKNLCYLCGIPVKTEGKGEEVESYYKDGDFEKIAKYCSEDVKATALLFAYINQHFLHNAYNFPSFEEINSLEVNIIVR